MDDKKILKIIDDNNETTEYEIILAFKWSKTNKNYVVYTDNTTNDDGNLNVYASIYYPDDDTKLDPIETDEEWNQIEERLDNLHQGVEIE